MSNKKEELEKEIEQRDAFAIRTPFNAKQVTTEETKEDLPENDVKKVPSLETDPKDSTVVTSQTPTTDGAKQESKQNDGSSSSGTGSKPANVNAGKTGDVTGAKQSNVGGSSTGTGADTTGKTSGAKTGETDKA